MESQTKDIVPQVECNSNLPEGEYHEQILPQARYFMKMRSINQMEAHQTQESRGCRTQNGVSFFRLGFWSRTIEPITLQCYMYLRNILYI